MEDKLKKENLDHIDPEAGPGDMPAHVHEQVKKQIEEAKGEE